MECRSSRCGQEFEHMTVVECLPEPEIVALRDGEAIIIRPIRPDDTPRLQALHSRLSPETIYLRFLDYHRALLDKEAERLATLDYQTRMALVATRKHAGDESILGVARYDVLGLDKPDVAEVAIVIEDRYQGRGLGTLLMNRLVAYARAHGIRAFIAEVSVENDRMLHFVQRTGLPIEKKLKSGVWEIQIQLECELDPVRDTILA